MSYRIGFGFDVHQLKDDTKLRIGGVDIDSDVSAVGHSDADVLLHAICDAMLGACGLGDIGIQFPDTDDAYKGIDSTILLENVYELVKKEGYGIVNIDSTICLELPKINPHRSIIIKKLAKLLSINEKNISVKATTNEKLGYLGRREGIAAYSVILLQKNL